MRHTHLREMIRALKIRAGILAGGENLTFDAETEALYGGVAATEDDPAWYSELHAALDARLPGDGDLSVRYRAFMDSFVVPPDRLESVFAAAFAESRRKTAERLPLPAGGERLEIATPPGGSHGSVHPLPREWDEPRPGERRSAGHRRPGTRLRLSRGLPPRPTHDATIREAALVRARGWIEYSVVTLASPLATVAEGGAARARGGGDDLSRPRARAVLRGGSLPPGRVRAGGCRSLRCRRYRVHGPEPHGKRPGSPRASRRRLSREEACRLLQDVLLLEAEAAQVRLRLIEELRAYPVALAQATGSSGITSGGAVRTGGNASSTPSPNRCCPATSPRTQSRMNDRASSSVIA